MRRAYAFLGVVFFFGVAFFVAGVLVVVLVTRPDLVLPRTAGLSTTAGAWKMLVRDQNVGCDGNLQL